VTRRADLVLAALTAGSVASWPLALARAGLTIAHHGGASRAEQSVEIIGPVAVVGTASLVLWLCRAGRTRPADFAVAGTVGAFLFGGTAFSVWELLYRTYESWTEWALVGARTLLLGALWAAPLTLPAGLLFGLTAFVIGRLLGMGEPFLWSSRAALRASAVMAIMIVQVGLAIWLRHASPGA
jgi:hypothetical protein